MSQVKPDFGKKQFFLLFMFAALFPVRIRYGFLVFESFSLLDMALLSSPFVLLLCGWQRFPRLYVGDRRIFLILCLPLLLAAISVLWSESPGQTVYYLAQTLLAIAAYLLAVNLLRDVASSAIVRFMAIFVMVAISTAALSFLHVPGFAPAGYGAALSEQDAAAFLLSYYTRLSHPLWGLSNAFATVIVFFAPVLLSWYFYARQKSYLVVFLLLTLAVVFTLSRGVGLAMIVGILFVLLMMKQGGLARFRKLTFVAFAMLMLVFAAVQWLEETILSSRLSLVNLESRFIKYRLALEKIAESPILGYGAGVVPGGEELLAGGVHNTFLQSMVNFGIPLGMALNGALLFLGVCLMKSPGPPRSGRASMVRLGVVSALITEMVVFLSQSSFEGVVLRTLFYFSVGMGVSLLRSLGRETGNTVPSADFGFKG